MLKSIENISKDLKLKYRFVCRKMGVPGYQIHQILLTEQQLIYIPVPKNGCTTVKQALHQMEFGSVFDSDAPGHEPYVDVHDFYQKREAAFTDKKQLFRNSKFTRFAIVRDPVERLISCYRNRVVDLGDLENDRVSLKKHGLSESPDINTFVLNLVEYRKVSKSIEHHSRLQSSFFGGTLSYLDKVFLMEDLNGVKDFLKMYKPDLKFLKRKTGGSAFSVSDLSDKALNNAVQFYRKGLQVVGRLLRSENSSKQTEETPSGAVILTSDSKPLISVIMPTHNRRELLGRAVDSVLEQTWDSLEIIIVDDASDDETPDYLKDLSDRYSNLQIVCNEVSKGAAVGRNIAIRQAKGEFITGLDDDDYWRPTRVERLMEEFEDGFSAVCSYDRMVMDEREAVWKKPTMITLDDLLYYNRVGNQVLTKKEYLEAVGGYDEDLPSAQDYDLWIRLVRSLVPFVR